MNKFHRIRKRPQTGHRFSWPSALTIGSCRWSPDGPGAIHFGGVRAVSDSELIAQFRRVEVASVSDAIEQITGKRMYMTHRMQPIFTS